jgi:phage baseplate assembly protein gpV
LVKMTDGVFSSGWLPWHEHNSNGGIKTRTMPTKGSQAVVRAMSGQLEQGTVTHSVYPTDTNKMPDAKAGEHVWQMGDDDNDSKGKPNDKKKQVKHTTDAKGNHSITASDSHTKTVGIYSHTMTKDGGHVLKAGDKLSYTMTKDGGHEIKAGDNFSYKMTADGGHQITAGGHTVKLTSAGMQIDAPTAFSSGYGVGNGPGLITLIDNATAGNGIRSS